MPTGYTSKIYEGEEVTGKEFIMTCARAFGALIEMRDESMDVEIPKELEVDTYHKTELDRSKWELKKYQNMTEEEAQKLVDQSYEETIKENKKYYNERLGLKDRYEKVLSEVKEWEIPSPEHRNLKDYAIRQLEDSIRFDCGGIETYAKGIKKDTPEQYIQKKIDNCRYSVKYHQKEWMKELERISERNLWIKQLRESLL